MCISTGLAANPVKNSDFPGYNIIVNGQSQDTSDLPKQPYNDGETVMVPLRRIGEALGYSVDWDASTCAITIEDTYIQKATLFNGTADVVFDGKLEIINMSRKVENSAKTVIHEGHTYVPAEFFGEFFNIVNIDGFDIYIEPCKSELHDLSVESQH